MKMILIALGAAVSLSALAQTEGLEKLPSFKETAEQQKAIMDALKNMSATNRGQVPGGQIATTAAGSSQAPNTPVGNRLSKEDFDRLAKSRKPVASPDALPKPPQADLMIFVSMSMPVQMLEQYAAQAKRFNAVLMMRGFVGDKLSETRATLQRLNKSGAQWEISPEPFVQFKIDKVPAIVMATAESESVLEDGCARPETYASIFGDLPVHDALDKMALRAQPSIATMAKARLENDRRLGAGR
jgi:type-F conjugative transfer system pilin assembly protein TrbC